MTNQLQCPECSTEIPWQSKMLRSRIRCLGCGARISPSKQHAATILATWGFALYFFSIEGLSFSTNPLLYATALVLFLAHYVVYVPLIASPEPD